MLQDKQGQVSNTAGRDWLEEQAREPRWGAGTQGPETEWRVRHPLGRWTLLSEQARSIPSKCVFRT